MIKSIPWFKKYLLSKNLLSVGEAFFPLNTIPNFLKYKIVCCVLGLRLGSKIEHLIEKKGAKKPPTTMKYAVLNKNCKACFHG